MHKEKYLGNSKWKKQKKSSQVRERKTFTWYEDEINKNVTFLLQKVTLKYLRVPNNNNIDENRTSSRNQ